MDDHEFFTFFVDFADGAEEEVMKEGHFSLLALTARMSFAFCIGLASYSDVRIRSLVE